MARLDMGILEVSHFAEKKPTADDYFELGIAHATGEGVPIDLVAAHKWFNLAALSGNEEAAFHRQDLAIEMTPAMVARAQRSAREYLARH